MRGIGIKTRRAWTQLHGWAGLFCSLLIFVLSLSGALASLSKGPMKSWSMPATWNITQNTPAAVGAMVKNVLERTQYGYRQAEIRFAGDGHERFIAVLLSQPNLDTLPPAQEHLHDPMTLKPILVRNGTKNALRNSMTGGTARFLSSLHTKLHADGPIPMIFISAAGLAFCVIIVTGIFIHGRLVADALRWRRSINLMTFMRDGHKLAGTWVIPFALLSSVTGLTLSFGLHYLLPAAALVSLKGDVEAARQVIQPDPRITVKQTVGDVALAPALHFVETSQASRRTARITIANLGSANASIRVSTDHGGMMCQRSYDFAAYTGTQQGQGCLLGRKPGGFTGILSAMFPLHKAELAGVFPYLWAAGGLCIAALAWSGTSMWYLKRATLSKQSVAAQRYHNLAQVSNSALGGFTVATASLCLSTPLFWILPPLASQPIARLGFAALFAGCGLFFYRRKMTPMSMLRIAAIITLVTPAAHLCALSLYLPQALTAPDILRTNACLLALGAATFAFSKQRVRQGARAQTA